jgi:hypothetical protein
MMPGGHHVRSCRHQAGGKTGGHDRGNEAGDCTAEAENPTTEPVRNCAAINKEKPAGVKTPAVKDRNKTASRD